MQPPPSLPAVLDMLRQALAREYGRTAIRVKIFTAEGQRPFSLDVPVPAAPAISPSEGETKQPFIPTPFQEAILDALEGKALRTDALGAAVGDRSRLYKPGGLQELREQGLVKHHPRLGFYRVDAPPEQLAD